MKYYAIGMILLTILSVNPTSDDGQVSWRNLEAVTETGSDLAFCQVGESISCEADLDYSHYYSYPDSTVDRAQYLTTEGVNVFEDSTVHPGKFTNEIHKNVPIDRQVGYQVTFERTVYTHEVSENWCGDRGDTYNYTDGYRADLYIYPISGNYQLAEFTGKDGDQFELTDAELAANTLTIHQTSDKMDFALDAPLDTANHRWLYEYFDEYGYDRTNHLEIQQSGVTASVDSFDVTSRFKISGIEVDNSTFEEANLRLLITLEDNGERLAMSIEDTPFSFAFERIGDAPSNSGMNKIVTRR